MAKTSKDAWRHVREWSDFFSDVKSVANDEIEAFLKKRKRKQYLKQSLKRLKARGFLLESNNSLNLTKKGLIFFRRQKLLASQNDLPKWDGKWRLISFDVPVKKNRERHQLRGLLAEFNFRPLHKSVWVSPYKSAEEFWRLLIDYELDEYCKIMTVEIIEGGEELRHLF